MSFGKDENNDLTYENMEYEDKINIEEASVNLSYVKKELDEEVEFEENQYKIALTYENMFGDSSTEQTNNRDSLIGFLDDDVIMKTENVKLEVVKEEKEDLIQETIEQSHFEIIQCHCCKTWFEEPKQLESHMVQCLKNYNRLCLNFQRKSADEIRGNSEISTPIHQNSNCLTQPKVMHSKYLDGIGEAYKRGCKNEKKHKCSECPYQTKYRYNLERHINAHNNIKPFQCDICNKKFKLKATLQAHIRNLHLRIKNQHSNINEKEYKCSECSYQTKNKAHLERHLNRHHDIKPFECGVCKKRFTENRNLKLHIKNLHSNTSEKEYKCSECSYQTTWKSNLKQHLNTHNDIKPFECGICKNRFNYKVSLKEHIKYLHTNASEKNYKCSECSYRTNLKSSLKTHLIRHKDFKPIVCDICKKKFKRKSTLKTHIINQHSEYKCPECSYRTNLKDHVKMHLNTHKDIKPFGRDVCKKKFSQKGNMKSHIKNKHSNTSENVQKYTANLLV